MFSHFFQVKSFSSLSVSVKNIYIKLNWVSIGFFKISQFSDFLRKEKRVNVEYVYAWICQAIIVRSMLFKLTLLSPESEDHVKCCLKII